MTDAWSGGLETDVNTHATVMSRRAVWRKSRNGGGSAVLLQCLSPMLLNRSRLVKSL